MVMEKPSVEKLDRTGVLEQKLAVVISQLVCFFLRMGQTLVYH